MPATYTPLRYPGGKSKLGYFLADLLKINKLVDGDYSEPYAGGGGAALFLLFRGYASRVFLNDIDLGVYSFWQAVLDNTEDFVREIGRVPLTVTEWERQREICRASPGGFELGFAFFYLNRTNRSGIMNGGVIGGRSQSGKWGIDARFNRCELARRVEAVGAFRRRISLSQVDALEFCYSRQAGVQRRQLFYLDPPYYAKGHHLYTNYYSTADHAAIAEYLRTLKLPWLLTYDDCPPVRKLYEGFRMLDSEVSYSARDVRRGREVVIFCGGMKLPSEQRVARRHRLGFRLMDTESSTGPSPLMA